MKRDSTIDIAKGVAICLIVIGHCYSSENPVLRSIYAFHMPFFFIVSGMLYADKWKKNVSIKVLNLLWKLIVPYFFFETLFTVFLLILQRSPNILGDLWNTFSRTILPMVGLTVTWFLPCQLLVVLGAGLLRKIASKHKRVSEITAFSVLFLVALIVSPANRYVVVLWRTFIGMGFFAVGYYGKKVITQQCKLCILCACVLAYLMSSAINGQVSMVSLDFSNPILYVVNGVLGTYILYQVCLKVQNWKIVPAVVYFGKNTAIVLCTHMFVVEVIRLLDYKLFNNVLYRLGIFEGFVFGAMVLAVMGIVIYVVNRYAWYLFGNKRRTHEVQRSEASCQS